MESEFSALIRKVSSAEAEERGALVADLIQRVRDESTADRQELKDILTVLQTQVRLVSKQLEEARAMASAAKRDAHQSMHDIDVHKDTLLSHVARIDAQLGERARTDEAQDRRLESALADIHKRIEKRAEASAAHDRRIDWRIKVVGVIVCTVVPMITKALDVFVPVRPAPGWTAPVVTPSNPSSP